MNQETFDTCKAWPWQEARQLARRNVEHKLVTFQTGYGPSGLPHIGTLTEVFRTMCVQQAFKAMCPDRPSRLVVFSDDMDAMRRVPSNIDDPNQVLNDFIGMPLCKVPDLTGEYPSFAARNNALLQELLGRLGIEYEFICSSEMYKSGAFDASLLAILDKIEDIQAAIIPTLREARASTYSPLMPICPSTGCILEDARIKVLDKATGLIQFCDSSGNVCTSSITQGKIKLQWKVDWAMRWHALNVSYEMCGKDLISSKDIAFKVISILGKQPPNGFIYEMFLDEDGHKISKSTGNGIQIDSWFKYALPQALMFFAYQNPRRAHRVGFESLSLAIDGYVQELSNMPNKKEPRDLASWFIHKGSWPNLSQRQAEISFNLILSLAGTGHTLDKATLYSFLSLYVGEEVLHNHPLLNQLLDSGIAYYKDCIAPHKKYKTPSKEERKCLEELKIALSKLPKDADGTLIQYHTYEIGKQMGYKEDLQSWFKMLYEVLMGQKCGPRIGVFAGIIGLERMCEMIEIALNNAQEEEEKKEEEK